VRLLQLTVSTGLSLNAAAGNATFDRALAEWSGRAGERRPTAPDKPTLGRARRRQTRAAGPSLERPDYMALPTPNETSNSSLR